MKPIATGRDEWWCNWWSCTKCQKVDEFYHSGNIARKFTYCPDCGVKIDWSAEENK